jgi:GNAT superfamily N-acetyltransferase
MIGIERATHSEAAADPAPGRDDPGMESHIQTAGISDAPAIAAVIRSAFLPVARRFNLTPGNCPRHPSNATTDWVRADMDRGIRYDLLTVYGRPTGCVGLEIPEPGLAYMERLSVRPSAQGHGYGRALVTHFLRQAAAAEATRISIGIIADQRELGRWYAQFGFIETGRRRFDHLPFEVAFMSKAMRMGRPLPPDEEYLP